MRMLTGWGPPGTSSSSNLPTHSPTGAPEAASMSRREQHCFGRVLVLTHGPATLVSLPRLTCNHASMKYGLGSLACPVHATVSLGTCSFCHCLRAAQCKHACPKMTGRAQGPGVREAVLGAGRKAAAQEQRAAAQHLAQLAAQARSCNAALDVLAFGAASHDWSGWAGLCRGSGGLLTLHAGACLPTLVQCSLRAGWHLQGTACSLQLGTCKLLDEARTSTCSKAQTIARTAFHPCQQQSF